MRSPASLLLEIGTVMTFPARPAHRIKAARRQRWISLAAFLILVGAWLFGYVNTRDSIAPSAASVLPGAVRIEPRGALFAGYDSAGALVGYAAASSAPGYGGPVMLLVGVNPDGAIIGVQVVTHRETPGFFRVLERDQYYEQFLGQTPADNLTLGQGIDGVSGATLSAEAVAQSIRDALRTVAGQELGVSMPPDEIPVKFGAPEIVLIGLFIAGFFAHRTRHKHAKKWLRWGTLITGMIALGFIYNKPFTVAHVTSFLAGCCSAVSSLSPRHRGRIRTARGSAHSARCRSASVSCQAPKSTGRAASTTCSTGCSAVWRSAPSSWGWPSGSRQPPAMSRSGRCST
jgi:uncharacterized protein with FMN-binding domain